MTKDISEIASEYRKNEDENLHLKNIKLLAKNFGSAEDKAYFDKRAVNTDGGLITPPNDDDWSDYCSGLWNKSPEEFRNLCTPLVED